jgi:hypothetical protein
MSCKELTFPCSLISAYSTASYPSTSRNQTASLSVYFPKPDQTVNSARCKSRKKGFDLAHEFAFIPSQQHIPGFEV